MAKNRVVIKMNELRDWPTPCTTEVQEEVSDKCISESVDSSC